MNTNQPKRQISLADTFADFFDAIDENTCDCGVTENLTEINFDGVKIWVCLKCQEARRAEYAQKMEAKKALDSKLNQIAETDN